MLFGIKLLNLQNTFIYILPLILTHLQGKKFYNGKVINLLNSFFRKFLKNFRKMLKNVIKSIYDLTTFYFKSFLKATVLVIHMQVDINGSVLFGKLLKI